MARKRKVKGVTRRDFIKAAGVGVVATGLGANVIVPGRSLAARKQLKILEVPSWSPTYGKWFDAYVREWGEKNDTEITVDREGRDIPSRALAEVKAQKGHDLFFFGYAPAAFEEHVINHREIYQECEKRYGKAVQLAVKTTYNPLTGKHNAFSPNIVLNPVN